MCIRDRADAVRELVKGLAFLSQARVRWLDAKGATLLDTGVPERTNVAFGGAVGVAVATAPDSSSATAAPPDVMLAVDIPLTQTAPVSQAIFLIDGSPAAAGGVASAALAGPNVSVVST